MRRKKCRAFECPKRIRDDELFCSMHLAMLQPVPMILDPIRSNREAPAAAGEDARASINAGVITAREYIAKREGRASSLLSAAKAQTVEPGQGGSGGGAYTGASLGTARIVSK